MRDTNEAGKTLPLPAVLWSSIISHTLIVLPETVYENHFDCEF